MSIRESFKNKVVFITGASSGIGKELAHEYAKNGANVILTARRFELINSDAKILSLKYNKCIAIKCDVTKDGDLEKVVQEGIKTFKKINIVIANAGFGVGGKLEDLKVEDYKKQFETNVFGVLRTIYATLPELKKTKGNLAIIGSVNGIVSFFTGSSAYIMSKFAIHGLIESLYLELLPYEISVTHIMPGFVETEFDIKDSEEEKRKYSWLKISAKKAAILIIQAIKNRELEVVLTTHGKIVVYLERYTPYILRKLSYLYVKNFK